MLTEVKALLHGVLSPIFYGLLWLAIFSAIFRKAERALYLLVILIPLPTIWYRLHDFPLGSSTLDLLIAAATIGLFVNKGGFERAPSSRVIFLLIVTSYLALWNATLSFDLPLPLTTANPYLSDWKNYAEMIYLYFLVFSLMRDEESQKTLVTIIAAVIFIIMVREVRNFSEGASFSYDKRVAGPFWIIGLGANHFGAFIAHYCSLLFGMYLFDKHRIRKWLYLGAAVFSLHPLFFAYSRGAYAAVLVAVLVFGILKKRSLLIGIAVLLVSWQSILPETVVERITMTESSAGQIEESAAHRLVLWQYAERDFQENPFFGVGFNAFGLTVPEGELTDTHNFYLKTAAEQGVIGLLVLSMVLLLALWSGWRLFRDGGSDFHRGLGLGFFACTIAVMITNVFGDRWSYFMLGSYFWIFWALVDRGRMIAASSAATAATATGSALASGRD